MAISTSSATTAKSQNTKPKATTAAKAAAATQAAKDAAALLKADHRKVEGLFAQYENASESDEKEKLAHQICKELIVHTKLEEEIFYPACREKDVEDDMLDEAQVEHDGAKALIAELINGSPDDEFYDAKVTVLSEYIKHHVGEEEKPRTGIFAKAQKAGVDMSGLGQKLQSRKQELVSELDENRLEPPKPRSLNPQAETNQEGSMPRNSNSNYRDRDERGRFTDDDDDRGGRGSRSVSSNDRDRDDRGRFMSDDDDRGSRGSSRSGGYSSRSREYDDDDDRGGRSSGGRGQGGWFGDSEGHSQASREGWEGRGGSSRSLSRGGSSSRGREYDDDDDRGGRSSGGRGQGGWFGDSEGHSQASREGWENRDGGSRNSSRGGSSSRSRDYDDDDDRGGRSSSSRGGGQGWFGDSEGHAEAAREGWENRGGSRSTSSRGGSSSRSRDDDDDDRGGRSSSSRNGGGRSSPGHGGWFGDSRGHAEAARRGWEDR
jgi:hemerythrin superfamily protein